MMDFDILDALREAISQFQQQALAELLKQIIIALRGQKYEFHEILGAIAQYTRSRDDWASVTEYIELAKIAVLEASARLQGTEQEE